jgi:hypothetical protein
MERWRKPGRDASNFKLRHYRTSAVLAASLIDPLMLAELSRRREVSHSLRDAVRHSRVTSPAGSATLARARACDRGRNKPAPAGSR